MRAQRMGSLTANDAPVVPSGLHALKGSVRHARRAGRYRVTIRCTATVDGLCIRRLSHTSVRDNPGL